PTRAAPLGRRVRRASRRPGRSQDITAGDGGHGWGNAELQYYTGEPDNAALDGAGHLASRSPEAGASGPRSGCSAPTSATSAGRPAARST
ncbi:MAG: hypothetical protein WAK44_27190, partial [Trebonia sp.]